MVTLQDIGHCFMKPAKELADWKFPLSQILEEYYALMSKPLEVNFSEAALVVQNSADVYMRRVDCLMNETSSLNSAFIEQEAEQINETSKCGRRHRSKIGIDLSDFKPLALEEEVGKNINIKNRCEQKPIKLLSQRFTQLEDDMAKLPIDILDIHGEVIGKKYDFRCNQQLSINGVLVDELTPKDFECDSFKQRLSLDAGFDTTRSSGYSSYASHSDYNSNCNESTTEPNIDTSIDNIDNTESTENNNDTTVDSDYTFIESPIDFAHSTENTVIENETESTGQNTNTDTNTDINNTIEKSINQDETDSKNLEGTLVENEISKGDNNQDIKSNDSIEEANPNKRRSQRVKKLMLKVDNINEKLWEPIPLTQNAPTVKVEKFKLPCSSCSPVKSKSETRKRKSVSKVKKRESLLKLLLTESKPSQKVNAPRLSTEMTIPPLKKEEIDEFEKEFDSCLKKTESIDEYHCKAVKTITMDLLDDQSYYSNNMNLSSDDSINNNVTPDYPPFSPIDATYESLSSCDEPIESAHSTSNYSKMVADKLKQIFEESNVQTDLEISVAKWHESLQPKLADAEQRSVFHLHDYTNHIVETLKSTAEQRLKFENVVQGEPASEVARYFLATLQLANMCNIELNTSHEKNCDIELILCDRETSSDNQ